MVGVYQINKYYIWQRTLSSSFKGENMLTITMLLGMFDNMPFGKHKGKKIMSLSVQYKCWLANNIPIEKLQEKFDEDVVKMIQSHKDWKYTPPTESRSSYSTGTWQDRAKSNYSSSEQMRKLNPNEWMECYRDDCSLDDWKDACRRVKDNERLGSHRQTTCNGHGY